MQWRTIVMAKVTAMSTGSPVAGVLVDLAPWPKKKKSGDGPLFPAAAETKFDLAQAEQLAFVAYGTSVDDPLVNEADSRKVSCPAAVGKPVIPADASFRLEIGGRDGSSGALAPKNALMWFKSYPACVLVVDHNNIVKETSLLGVASATSPLPQ